MSPSLHEPVRPIIGLASSAPGDLRGPARHSPRMDRNPIFCAIDTADEARAAALISAVAPHVGGVKLGLEFFVANGPEGVRRAASRAASLFLDLKLHDIPNTVAGAVGSVLRLQPLIVTVHCSGGPAMMSAAVSAARTADGLGLRRPRIVGVTVLTSLDEGDLGRVGQPGPMSAQVERLGILARDSGLDGIVCSPQEVALLRAACGPDFLLVVPGIRPAGSAIGDQKRVMTPAQAIAAGADWLVLGRPITAAGDPAQAARNIVESLMQGAAAS